MINQFKVNKWNILEVVNHWLQSITGLLQKLPLVFQLGTQSFAQLRAPWEGEVLRYKFQNKKIDRSYRAISSICMHDMMRMAFDYISIFNPGTFQVKVQQLSTIDPGANIRNLRSQLVHDLAKGVHVMGGGLDLKKKKGKNLAFRESPTFSWYAFLSSRSFCLRLSFSAFFSSFSFSRSSLFFRCSSVSFLLSLVDLLFLRFFLVGFFSLPFFSFLPFLLFSSGFFSFESFPRKKFLVYLVLEMHQHHKTYSTHMSNTHISTYNLLSNPQNPPHLNHRFQKLLMNYALSSVFVSCPSVSLVTQSRNHRVHPWMKRATCNLW